MKINNNNINYISQENISKRKSYSWYGFKKTADFAANFFRTLSDQKTTQIAKNSVTIQTPGRKTNLDSIKTKVDSLTPNERIDAFTKLVQKGTLLETDFIPHEAPPYQALKDLQEDMNNGKAVDHKDLELLYDSILSYAEESNDKMEFYQLIMNHVEKPTPTDHISAADTGRVDRSSDR